MTHYIFSVSPLPDPTSDATAEPMRAAPDCTISVTTAPTSLIEKSDAQPVVVTAFGRAKGGQA